MALPKFATCNKAARGRIREVRGGGVESHLLLFPHIGWFLGATASVPNAGAGPRAACVPLPPSSSTQAFANPPWVTEVEPSFSLDDFFNYRLFIAGSAKGSLISQICMQNRHFIRIDWVYIHSGFLNPLTQASARRRHRWGCQGMSSVTSCVFLIIFFCARKWGGGVWCGRYINQQL